MVKQIISADAYKTRKVFQKDGENYLNVSEFFYDTIQGEGIYMGHPATFLRLQGCELGCTYCFGIKPGRHVPRITMLNGINKRIDQIKKGDILLTFDSKTKKLVETTVTFTTKRKVTKWNEIYAKNHSYFVTPEHPFFTTDNKLKKADQLTSKDEIYHSSSQQKMTYKMTMYNPMYNEESRNATVRNTDYKKLGETISKTIKRKQKEGTYISSITSFKENNPKKYKKMCKEKSEKMQGANNPWWTGGSKTPNYDRIKKELTTRKFICQKCKESRWLEVHHKDEDRTNDKENNMIKICHECHSQIHERGYNFWNGKRKDGRTSKTADKVLNGIKIISNKQIDIKKNRYYGKLYGPKELTVYNLSCSPHNTYLIDDMWVHNCDTTEVWRHGSKYTFEELFTLINSTMLIPKLQEGQHLVLTGGSPLLQTRSLYRFIQYFIDRLDFRPFIEIENECVINPPNYLIYYVDCWNNSPKLSGSGVPRNVRYRPEVIRRMSLLHNSWFKFVVDSYLDWKEIEEDFINPGYIDREQVILMPQGATRIELEKNRPIVVDMAIQHGVRYSDRLHIQLWDKTVGC